MDIVALLSTNIPSYFVLGPLVVVLIVLLVFISKKTVQSPGIAVIAPIPPQVQVPPTSNQVIQAPIATPAPAPSPVFVAPVAPVVPVVPQSIVQPVMQAPVQQVPVISSVATTSPEPSIVQQVQVPVVEEVKQAPPPVPPLSSWKPSQPSPSAVQEVVVPVAVSTQTGSAPGSIVMPSSPTV